MQNKRFVILEHDYPELHWDFMIEIGQELLTWKLLEIPQKEKIIEAIYTFPHRLFYLDYEGEVSQNRGFVKRWDKGYYQEIDSNADRLLLSLHGLKLNGIIELRRSSINGNSVGNSENELQKWVFIHYLGIPN